MSVVLLETGEVHILRRRWNRADANTSDSRLVTEHTVASDIQIYWVGMNQRSKTKNISLTWGGGCGRDRFLPESASSLDDCASTAEEFWSA